MKPTAIGELAQIFKNGLETSEFGGFSSFDGLRSRADLISHQDWARNEVLVALSNLPEGIP